MIETERANFGVAIRIERQAREGRTAAAVSTRANRVENDVSAEHQAIRRHDRERRAGTHFDLGIVRDRQAGILDERIVAVVKRR
jgi:hypothetical protein